MDYTVVGQITSTHGVRGSVKVYPITSFIERFYDLKKVYIGEEKNEVNVKSVFIKKNTVVISFAEYSDVNEVIPFISNYIYVSDEDRVKLPEGYYFIHELIGCKVVDEKQNELGVIKDVLQGFSNDVYVIKNKDNEFMVPVVKEFIKNVNISDKIIQIKLIDGMME